MDKTLFLEILQRYARTSVEEANKIASLRTEFPYCQVLHALSARASKDHGLQHQQRDLQLAAVYAADRNRLKELITLTPEDPARQVISKHVDADAVTLSTIDSADVADVVMDDLERLSKLKHTFENLFMDYPRSMEQVTKVQDDKKKADAPPAAADAAASATKSKKERIIEMAKVVTNSPGEERPSKKKRLDKDGNPVDELIREIQASKDEIVAPGSPRQKQQIEIINQFIRVQPSISNPKDRLPSPAGDLTPVKSGEFGDNIVSETLVEILIKQGKKDKAIEVLKKLIWKYPQKKAYFASQIEDLKK